MLVSRNQNHANKFTTAPIDVGPYVVAQRFNIQTHIIKKTISVAIAKYIGKIINTLINKINDVLFNVIVIHY